MFGKFGGYLAAGTGVIGLILGLVFGGLLAGNASVTVDPSASPSASATPSAQVTDDGISSEQTGDDEFFESATAAEMKVVNDPKFPQVRYQFQLDFFKLAIANCENLEKNGVVLSFVDGRTAILGENKDGDVARNNYDSNGKEDNRYVPLEEVICLPKYFHDDALRQPTQHLRSFYHLDPMGDEKIKQYAWHQHVDWPELSTVYFTFEGGVLNHITDWDAAYYYDADVAFGLTKAQQALLQEVDS